MGDAMVRILTKDGKHLIAELPFGVDPDEERRIIIEYLNTHPSLKHPRKRRSMNSTKGTKRQPPSRSANIPVSGRATGTPKQRGAAKTAAPTSGKFPMKRNTYGKSV